jgi:hypothetical protein
MELGNMIFGNSRGEYPVDRAWQDDFCQFLYDCGLDGRGYYDKENQYQTSRGGFENDVFLVNPYDWNADCTCGFDDMNYEWWEENQHTDNCFATRIEKYKNKLKQKGIDLWSDKYITLVDNWAKVNGWGHGWKGHASYCDCGVHRRYDEWAKDKEHKDNCRLIQPNFWYKPTGFKLNFYKYPLRDAYMNQNITFEELKEIMQKCKESVHGQN